jgi:DNA-3-methyladenine glycosylase I
LKKANNFRVAYSGFDIDKIAAYDETDRARLLSDAGIIRNRLKVNAAIENARRIQGLRSEHGSFKGWLDSYYPQTLENWTKLFKRNFILRAEKSSKNF